MPTPSFCWVIWGNIVGQKVRVLASLPALDRLLYCAEWDLKTGGPPRPFFLRPYLLGTYSDRRNLRLARVPTYCPHSLKIGIPSRPRKRRAANPRETLRLLRRASGVQTNMKIRRRCHANLTTRKCQPKFRQALIPSARKCFWKSTIADALCRSLFFAPFPVTRDFPFTNFSGLGHVPRRGPVGAGSGHLKPPPPRRPCCDDRCLGPAADRLDRSARNPRK